MDNSGALIIPPTIDAAMRCMTSQPVPLVSGARLFNESAYFVWRRKND